MNCENSEPRTRHVDMLLDGKSETYILEPLQESERLDSARLEVRNGGTARLHLLFDGKCDSNFSVDVEVGEGCDVMVSAAMINGSYVCLNLNVNITGEHSTFRAPGIILPSDYQSFRYSSAINHKAGHSATYQRVRTVAAGNGQADFFGIVKVQRNAQKSETEQANNNILLSETARIESKPQLEIYADDVKCSHGSTTGMLDKDQIFYMRSRGISEKTAQALLLQAFLAEVISEIDTGAYAEKLAEAIRRKL